MKKVFENGLGDLDQVSKELRDVIKKQNELYAYYSSDEALFDFLESYVDMEFTTDINDIMNHIKFDVMDVENERAKLQPGYVPSPYMYASKFMETANNLCKMLNRQDTTNTQKLFRVINTIENKRDDLLYSILNNHLQHNDNFSGLFGQETIYSHSKWQWFFDRIDAFCRYLNYAANDQFAVSTACNLITSKNDDVFGDHANIINDTEDNRYVQYQGSKRKCDLPIPTLAALLYLKGKTIKSVETFQKQSGYYHNLVECARDIRDYVKNSDNYHFASLNNENFGMAFSWMKHIYENAKEFVNKADLHIGDDSFEPGFKKFRLEFEKAYVNDMKQKIDLALDCIEKEELDMEDELNNTKISPR